MELIQMSDDMGVDEKETLRKYRADGCPGLIKVDANKVSEWFKLYMAGKSYHEIAQITHHNKGMVLYIAEKGKWHDRKMEKYRDIGNSLLEKAKNIQLDSANSVTTMVSALNKYFTKKLDKYLSTNDDTIIENLDTKLLTQYHKCIEALEKLVTATQEVSSPSPGADSSQINININTPAEIIEGDQAIDISKTQSSSDMLKTLLALKKSRKKD